MHIISHTSILSHNLVISHCATNINVDSMMEQITLVLIMNSGYDYMCVLTKEVELSRVYASPTYTKLKQSLQWEISNYAYTFQSLMPVDAVV